MTQDTRSRTNNGTHEFFEAVSHERVLPVAPVSFYDDFLGASLDNGVAAEAASRIAGDATERAYADATFAAYPELDGEVGVVNVTLPYGDVRRYGTLTPDLDDATTAGDNSTAIENCFASIAAVLEIGEAQFPSGTYFVARTIRPGATMVLRFHHTTLKAIASGGTWTEVTDYAAVSMGKYALFNIVGMTQSSVLGRVALHGNDVANITGLVAANPNATTGGTSGNVVWLADTSIQNCWAGLYGQSDGVGFTGWFIAYVRCDACMYSIYGVGNTIDDMTFGVVRCQGTSSASLADGDDVYLERCSGVTFQSLFMRGVNVETTIAEAAATSGTTTTITRTGAGRTVNADAGRLVEITGGTGSGNRRVIVSNTADTWTLATAWDVAPDATSVFTITEAKRDGLVINNGSVTAAHCFPEGDFQRAIGTDGNGYKIIIHNLVAGKTVLTTRQAAIVRLSNSRGYCDVGINNENVSLNPQLAAMVSLAASAVTQQRTTIVRSPIPFATKAPFRWDSGTNASGGDTAIAYLPDGVLHEHFTGTSRFHWIERKVSAVATTLVAGNSNDLDPGDVEMLLLAGDVAGTSAVTGIAGGVSGRRLFVVNTSANAIALNTLGAQSVATNRLSGNNTSPVNLRQNGVCELVYDGITGRWRVIKFDAPINGSATYNPASLNDGVGATTTVTVTGAVLGDYAEASFSLDLQGITMTAWVSATDTVSVRFQNESGGTIDLASGTLRARVRKA